MTTGKLVFFSACMQKHSGKEVSRRARLNILMLSKQLLMLSSFCLPGKVCIADSHKPQMTSYKADGNVPCFSLEVNLHQMMEHPAPCWVSDGSLYFFFLCFQLQTSCRAHYLSCFDSPTLSACSASRFATHLHPQLLLF